MSCERGLEPEASNSPRIYIASLADYNNGRLHGTWVPADKDPEGIARRIAEMLKRSPEAGAEEWAIHDHEGFGPIRLGESTSVQAISLLGRGIAQYGMAFAHWAAYVGTGNRHLLARFGDHYLGQWSSMAEYAKRFLDDLGGNLDNCGPHMLRLYTDLAFEAFVDDLRRQLYVAEVGESVYVFHRM